jgi:multiple antibiotic resistance protein
MEHWTEYTRFLTALLVILDPFVAIPILLALTQGYTVRQRAQVVSTATATVAVVLIAAAVAGEHLLLFMGTSLASFRLA